MGMKFRMGGCGPRGFEFPEGLFAMGFGPRGGGWGRGWGGWDADWGGGSGWGRRGRRRVFEPGELRLVLLKLIADQPRHGYDLIRAIEEMTHGTYAPSPGVVYPTLTMLQDMGLIEETKGEGSRKAFAATDEGRAHLEEKADEVDALRRAARGHGQRPAQGRRRPDQARGRQPALRALAPRHPRRGRRADPARHRRHPRRGGAEDRAAERIAGRGADDATDEEKTDQGTGLGRCRPPV